MTFRSIADFFPELLDEPEADPPRNFTCGDSSETLRGAGREGKWPALVGTESIQRT